MQKTQANAAEMDSARQRKPDALFVPTKDNPQKLFAPTKVRVVRAFYFERVAQKVGDTVELPLVFALEMCAAGKAVRV